MNRKLLFHNTHEMALFKRARAYVKPCEILLDVGAGIRPQQMVRCKQHWCAEPHDEYAAALQRNGYRVIRARAGKALDRMAQVDTIVALDVIEHMERAEGEAFLRKAMQKARQQVVVLTPLGFMEQDGGADEDPWGMQGQQWQKHRSGWMPADFPGWVSLVDERFYKSRNRGAFFAIWTR